MASSQGAGTKEASEKKEGVGGGAPLDAIKDKELELKTELMQAQKDAEKSVAAARQEAVKIREAAEKEGVAQGESTYKKEIEAAKKEAEEIRKVGLKEAEAAFKAGEKNIDKAAARVSGVVIPGLSTSDGRAKG